jgi:hypothetical protein
MQKSGTSSNGEIDGHTQLCGKHFGIAEKGDQELREAQERERARNNIGNREKIVPR